MAEEIKNPNTEEEYQPEDHINRNKSRRAGSLAWESVCAGELLDLELVAQTLFKRSISPI